LGPALFLFFAFPSHATEPTKPADVAHLAEVRIAGAKELVHKARTKAAPQKNSAGLTAEDEARLFGKKVEDTGEVKAWSYYFTEAEHRKTLEELRASPKLRFELRRQLASLPKDANAETKEAYGFLTALVSEAEKKTDAPKDGESLKPLNPEDAFGLDPDDVKALDKR
jgi:hypothetical protein